MAETGAGRSAMVREVSSVAVPVAKHTVGLCVALVGMWIVEQLLHLLFGHDAKFFDVVPIRYVVHLSDLAMLLRFAYLVVLEMKNDR